MIKRHKDLLRALVGELRRTLAGTPEQRGDLDRELERLGIAPDGKMTPLDALPNPSPAERRARRVADARVESLPLGERATARAELVEQAAYSWINRLLALRAMEARGLIEETLRSNPEYDGISEALYILRQTDPASAGGADAGWWAVIETACAVHAESLPGLFDPSDPATALRPSTTALLRSIGLVGGKLPGFSLAESDAALADPDAIGWAYQFYQEEAKARVYAKLGSGGKVTSRSDIAAATQLFTEPYMVQWLLQNSLGRSYHEAYPESKLPETWPYYIKLDKETQRPEFGTQPTTLPGLTVLDPCMGSGHFLRGAFDMLALMYREQFPAWDATQVADTILRDHLFGVDIDPRAAQLAALTLYLRARELVRDEGRARRLQRTGDYQPTTMNLATTPTGLSAGALDRHLQRHPGDHVFKPLLEGIFAALEQADILGSLLHPSEHLDRAIAGLQRPHTTPLPFDSDEAALRGTMTEMARQNPAELKRLLLDRIATSFAADGVDSDVVAALFGREVERGVRLLQVLDKRYAVVVTNPPYMGSKNMDALLRRYIEQHYPPAKRDLYAAFILRCLELALPEGRVAMITMHSWMFLRSFADLRALPEPKLAQAHKKALPTGLFRQTELESVAHLGPAAFDEISGEVVQSTMFSLSNQAAGLAHVIRVLRVVGAKSAAEKARMLREPADSGLVYYVNQLDLIAVDGAPLTYWLLPTFAELLRTKTPFGRRTFVRQGICTTNNVRFLRNPWEVPSGLINERWYLFAKGGGTKRWSGLDQHMVDWEADGSRVKRFQEDTPGAIHWSGRIPDSHFFFKPAWTFSRVARGTVGARELPSQALFGHTSPAAIPFDPADLPIIGFWLNTRLTTYLLRALTQSLDFREGHIQRLHLPDTLTSSEATDLIDLPLNLQRWFNTLNPLEWLFSGVLITGSQQEWEVLRGEVTYLTAEAWREQIAVEAVQLANEDIKALCDSVGTPSGWFPLLIGYEAFPSLESHSEFCIPTQMTDYVRDRPRLLLSQVESLRLKTKLRALYEAGSGSKEAEQSQPEMENDEENEEGQGMDVEMPIPTETFLDELSQKLQIHPISVYWLLEELKAEGVRCKPEEQRLLEERLSVLVLRLLGHRWPKQIEDNEAVPEWADQDGVISLTVGASEQTLSERLRERLRAEDGELGAQKTEALLQELAGQTLEEWLRRRFFERHIRQFKYRPIAWHLASAPSSGAGKKRTSGRSIPAFECVLYYHATDRDVLARIRTQYVEPLLRQDRQRVADARQANDEAESALATGRIHELEDFTRRLREVEDEGFACAELEAAIAKEQLDRWNGDGYLPAASSEDLRHREQAWRVDINDGVRVNIAPLQLASLLASDVLKAADAKKAIADRARWRSDERRWVREGKLPRCGWMREDVPESKRWAELSTQREAEQMKLEAKRRMAPGEGFVGEGAN